MLKGLSLITLSSACLDAVVLEMVVVEEQAQQTISDANQWYKTCDMSNRAFFPHCLIWADLNQGSLLQWGEMLGSFGMLCNPESTT